jgi:hypothetical protein
MKFSHFCSKKKKKKRKKKKEQKGGLIKTHLLFSLSINSVFKKLPLSKFGMSNLEVLSDSKT